MRQGQIFGWFLKPIVSYHFIRRANEPVHSQLGLIESMATVANHTLEPRTGFKVRVRVYDLSMHLFFDKHELKVQP
jgi:hypothetical protein